MYKNPQDIVIQVKPLTLKEIYKTTCFVPITQEVYNDLDIKVTTKLMDWVLTMPTNEMKING